MSPTYRLQVAYTTPTCRLHRSHVSKNNVDLEKKLIKGLFEAQNQVESLVQLEELISKIIFFEVFNLPYLSYALRYLNFSCAYP